MTSKKQATHPFEGPSYSRRSEVTLFIAATSLVVLLACVFSPVNTGFEGLKLFAAWLYGAPVIAIFALAGIIFELIARRLQEINKVRKKIIAANLLIIIAAAASLPALLSIEDLQEERKKMQMVKLAQSGKAEDLYKASRILLRLRMTVDQQREGLQYLIRAADLGNALAQFELAVMYYHGRLDVVQRDDARAKVYHAKAVSNGNASAKWWINESVKTKKLFGDYLEKARLGDASEQCRVGVFYIKGVNFVLNRSYYEAAKWMTKSINSGQEACRFSLENLFLRYPSAWEKIKTGDSKARVQIILEQATQIKTGVALSRSKNPTEKKYWSHINRLYKESSPGYDYKEWVYIHGKNHYVVVFHAQPRQPKENWKVVYKKLLQVNEQ